MVNVQRVLQCTYFMPEPASGKEFCDIRFIPIIHLLEKKVLVCQ